MPKAKAKKKQTQRPRVMINGKLRIIPRMTLHKGSGQACCRIDGRRVYLGVWGTHDAQVKYQALLADWQGGGGHQPVDVKDISIVELIALYWEHCLKHYRKRDGSNTSEIEVINAALKPLKESFGVLPAAEFSPLRLRGYQTGLITERRSRSTINRYVSRVRRMFRWAAARQLIPHGVSGELASVEALEAYRSDAREISEPVTAVDPAVVEATLKHLPGPLRALIELQRHNGARPGEMLRLRPCDIDMTRDVWQAILTEHKTSHKGKPRVIMFGKRGQKTLKPFLLRDKNAYLFSPRECLDEVHRQGAKNPKRTNRADGPPKTKRVVGEYFTTRSYAKAIARAAKKAGVPHWHPNMLRHLFATEAREKGGLDSAQVALGHAYADVTQLYAELDIEKARAIMRRIG